MVCNTTIKTHEILRPHAAFVLCPEFLGPTCSFIGTYVPWLQDSFVRLLLQIHCVHISVYLYELVSIHSAAVSQGYNRGGRLWHMTWARAARLYLPQASLCLRSKLPSVSHRHYLRSLRE